MLAPKSPTQHHQQVALISPRQGITITEIEPPLDYSFYNMASLSDIEFWEPRQSFVPPRKLTMDTEVLDNEPRPGAKANTTKQKAITKPAKSKCFKLSNNCLSDVADIKTVAGELFENADDIAWLDLSFNELAKVDDILLAFPNLQILYLHGNQINDLKEVAKLAKVTTLRKLTLHGNPVENEKGYKYQVTALLPTLQTLDFGRITKADRKTACTLEVMNKNVKKGKRKPKEAED